MRKRAVAAEHPREGDAATEGGVPGLGVPDGETEACSGREPKRPHAAKADGAGLAA